MCGQVQVTQASHTLHRWLTGVALTMTLTPLSTRTRRPRRGSSRSEGTVNGKSVAAHCLRCQTWASAGSKGGLGRTGHDLSAARAWPGHARATRTHRQSAASTHTHTVGAHGTSRRSRTEQRRKRAGPTRATRCTAGEKEKGAGRSLTAGARGRRTGRRRWTAEDADAADDEDELSVQLLAPKDADDAEEDVHDDGEEDRDQTPANSSLCLLAMAEQGRGILAAAAGRRRMGLGLEERDAADDKGGEEGDVASSGPSAGAHAHGVGGGRGSSLRGVKSDGGGG